MTIRGADWRPRYFWEAKVARPGIRAVSVRKPPLVSLLTRRPRWLLYAPIVARVSNKYGIAATPSVLLKRNTTFPARSSNAHPSGIVPFRALFLLGRAN